MTRTHPRSRGMAVIAALVVVMVATVLVTGLLQRQATDMRALENEMSRLQARQLMTAGVDWARLIMRADASRSNITVLQGQLWSTPIEDTRIPTDDGARTAVLSGQMQDEQGKFNLRNIADNGAPNPSELLVLVKLLGLLELQPSLAPHFVERIALAQAIPAAASDSGEGNGLARPPLVPMPVRLDDFAGMEGMSPALVERLRPYLTVLPARTNVNVNTAAPELIAALTDLPISAARGIAGQREAGRFFTNTADFNNVLNGARAGASDTNLTPDVVVSSNWFLVKGAVTLDRAVVGMQALLQRGTDPSPSIIWIRELP